MARKQYMSIHFMRIMACLMVLLIHVTATPVVTLIPNSPAQAFFVVLNQMAKPAVPIFIFISGFLLHSIYQGKQVSLLGFYKKRLPKLIGPYILWSLGYYAIYLKLGLYPFDIFFVIKGLILGTFIYHLYFMVIIIQFYLLYPMLHRIASKFGNLLTFTMMFILQLALIRVPFEWRDRFFVTYLCYFGLGMVLSRYLPQWVKLCKPYLVHFLIFIGVGSINAWLYYNSINAWIQFPSTINSLFYIALSSSGILSLMFGFEGLTQRLNLNDQHERSIRVLGDATQLIYYAHPLFILGSEFMMNQLGVLSISLRALSAFLSILFLLVPFAYWIKAKKEKTIAS